MYMAERHLVDLQVNGFAGVDFNADNLSSEQLTEAAAALRRHATYTALATIITDRFDRMESRIRRLADEISTNPEFASTVRGIHVEGPFLSAQPGYVGAHPAHEVLPATVDAAKRLIDAGNGLVRLVTLAPEHDANAAATAYLAGQGIVVAAGHCDPTIAELQRAIDNGLTMFTHLGNGCPLQMHRHDNVIQRVLSKADQLWVCFIADGVHVPYFALANYLRLVGLERAIVVSDAISAAGLGPGVFTLAGMEVVVDDHLATWTPDRSHLVGSAMPLNRALDELIGRGILSQPDAVRLACDNPRRAISLGAASSSGG
jgi:N-acetylglucosamine-6-phosphate deacetylase